MPNSDSTNSKNTENCESSLQAILKNSLNYQSNVSLMDEFSQTATITIDQDFYKIISNGCSNQSNNEQYFAGSFGDNILEEHGRISLAYENLKKIPKQIAEKYAEHTKFLDLSYNNFQNLSFLSYFENLHTLILDRNTRLDVNSLPFLPNLIILWMNNCEIMNISDWLHRIKRQCPFLEQLSMMGNHGQNHWSTTSLILTSTVSNYREYVFSILPNLQYLDGIQKFPPTQSNQVLRRVANDNVMCNKNNDKNNNNNSSALSTDNSLSHSNNSNSSILPANIRDFFRLKKRKKSFQSSSTN